MARWRKDIDIKCNGVFEHQEYMESKLKEDESVLVASRVKRQLVGSERCGQHHHHHHRHRYRNLYCHRNHNHSGIESVIYIMIVDVILLNLISGLSSRYLVSFADTRRTGMMDEKVAPMVITDTGMIQGSFQ